MPVYQYSTLIEHSPTDETVAALTKKVTDSYAEFGLPQVSFALERFYKSAILRVEVYVPLGRVFPGAVVDTVAVTCKVDGHNASFLLAPPVCTDWHCKPHVDGHAHPTTIDSYVFAGEDKVGTPPNLPTPV